jgi:hypothetical protein
VPNASAAIADGGHPAATPLRSRNGTMIRIACDVEMMCCKSQVVGEAYARKKEEISMWTRWEGAVLPSMCG